MRFANSLSLLVLTLWSSFAAAQSNDCTGESSPVLRVAGTPSSVEGITITAGIATLAIPLTALESKSTGEEIEITLGSSAHQSPQLRFHCPSFYFGPKAAGPYTVKLYEAVGGMKSLVATKTFEVSDAGSPTYTNVIPKYPVAGEPFSIRIRGNTPHSPAIVQPHRTTIEGSVIKLEGCVSGGGFAVPDYYVASAGVAAVPAGRYRVEYHRCYFDYPPPLGDPALLTSFDVEVKERGPGWPALTDAILPVSEYLHEGFQHRFVTADEREQVALDSHVFEGWQLQRTSGSEDTKFGFWRDGEGLLPICRFFSVAFAPKSSHFYTADQAECEHVKTNPDWIYEGIVGRVAARNASGKCSVGTPLFRLYNNGNGGAPNHRYTTNASDAEWFSANGWLAEGILGCVPSIPPPYRP